MDRGSHRNGLASPARCMVRKNCDYTSVVRLFVMHNSRSIDQDHAYQVWFLNSYRFAGINSLTDFLKDVSLTTVCVT